MIKLNELKQTQSYKRGLISVQELNGRQSKVWGAAKQPLPQAEADKTKQHILLLRNNNDELGTPRFFINSPVSFEFNNQADEMVVVSIKTTPMSLTLSSPALSSPPSASGYPLQAGNIHVDTLTTISFCAQDCEQLWLLWDNQEDPLDMLEACAEAKSKRYFDNKALGDLLDPFDLIQVRQSAILNQAAKKAATDLEDRLMTIQVDGLHLREIDVDAVIQVNPTSQQDIKDQLQQLKDEFKITKELLEPLRKAEEALLHRRCMDALLDKDMRFAPHTLRQAIMLFDPVLIEQFYQDGWENGVEALNEKIKETRHGLQKMERINALRNCIKLAQDSGATDEDVKPIRADLMNQIVEMSSELQLKGSLYEEFFRSSIGLTKPMANQPALPAPESAVAS